MFGEVDQPGVGTLLANTVPLRLRRSARARPRPRRRLGPHTEAVLTELLGLSAAQYGKLHDAGVVAGPDAPKEPVR